MAETLRLGFGEGSITEREWGSLKEALSGIGAKRVLEIGAGYSTVLLAQAGYEVLSLETDPRWAARVGLALTDFPAAEVVLCKYPELATLADRYDAAFVDGPAGGGPDGRQASMELAASASDLVIVHDAGRAAEKQAIANVFDPEQWQPHPMAGSLVRFSRERGPSESASGPAPAAVFLAVTANYQDYATCLLHSLSRQGCTADVHVIGWRVTDEWQTAVDAADFGYAVHWHAVKRDMLPEEGELPISNNLFVKQARYLVMREAAKPYQVACLLDCDMLVVSQGFWALFDLVRGTRHLIGCNEAFKWVYGEQHVLDLTPGGGTPEPFFVDPRQALRFSCNSPAIFCPSEWDDVLSRYAELAWWCYEQRNDGTKRLGDIFTWNAAILLAEREADLILMPMETMTQVHHTDCSQERRIIKRKGVWQTQSGDLVYTLHNRPLGKQWLERQMDVARRVIERAAPSLTGEALTKHLAKVESGLRAIQAEWQDHLKGSISEAAALLAGA